MEENIVIIEDIARKFYIKKFEKKYKDKWEITLEALREMLSRIEKLLQTQNAEIIIFSKEIEIIKVDFKIAGTKESAKTSGNRCIVARHKDKNLVKVLLVYSKNDIPSKNETVAWKKFVRDNYREYKSVINI